MRTHCLSFRGSLSAAALALLVLNPAPILASSLIGQTTFESADEETGTGVAANGTGPVILNFNSLPSAQGWTYTTSGLGESSFGVGQITPIFSVDGATLHQNTIGTGLGAGGTAFQYYFLNGVVDPTKPFTFEVRASVLQSERSDSGGFSFGVFTGNEGFEVFMDQSTIEDAFQTTIGANSPGFHDYRLEGTPGVGYKVFVDGSLIASGLPNPAHAGLPNQIFFGDSTSGGNAQADVTRLVFSQSSQSCMSVPSGLISWWPGDGNTNDIAGGNNGVPQGSLGYTTGMVGEAFSLNGVDAYIETPASLMDSPALTFEAWVKTTEPEGVIISAGDARAPANTGYATDLGFILSQYGAGEANGAINFYPNDYSTQTYPVKFTLQPYNDGQWHHVVGVFNNTGSTAANDLTIYVDGVAVPQASYARNPYFNGTRVSFGSLRIGRCNRAPGLYEDSCSGIKFFKGLVDEVAVYNRALTAAEIQSIYLAGTAGKCKGGPPPVNLPPVADAGASRQVKVGEQVVLDGSKSYDPEGQQITPSWSFLSRPAGSASQLTGAATLQPFFVPDQGGDYKIRLDITDPQGASASALVTITASSNRPPVAVIAPVSGDLKAPTETVLDGRGSSDPDGDPISFKWRLVSKPGASLIPIQGGILVCPLGGVCSRATLSGVTSSQPTLYMDMVGDYVVELTVFDTNGLSGTTQRKITALGGGVKPPPPPPPSPMSCTIQSGFAPGTIYTVQYVKCNGKQISPYAYNTSRPGYGMEFLKPVPGLGGVGLASTNQSVAYWIYETQSTTGLSTKTTTYKANCTRNPLATPVSITGTAVEDLTKHEVITDFKISGSTVTSKICEFGSVVGCRSYTKLLPSGCSTQ